jgi:hypothetical protein
LNRSLKNLAVSATVAASLHIAVLAQPNPENNASALFHNVRLDQFMDNREQSLKYNAPDDLTSEKVAENALQNLELFAENAESSLKYRVPVEYEDQSVQNLELLAQITMDELKYRAPGNDGIQESLAEKMTAIRNTSRPVKVEVFNSPQVEWLINAGYYKSTRTPAWDKVKKSFNIKSNEKQFISAF